MKLENIPPVKIVVLSKKDLAAGSLVAVVMGFAFVWVGGRPLLFTFVPGLIVVWCVFAWMRLRGVAFPDATKLYPFYFGTLAWQFVHFTEEFTTGFPEKFPALFGAEPFPANLFIAINMLSYFGFVAAFILTFVIGIRFLLVPVLFFTIYGAIGNAISHTYWIFSQSGYFPGAVTAQLYWIVGPLLLSRFMGALRPALIITCGFAVLLVAVLMLTMHGA